MDPSPVYPAWAHSTEEVVAHHAVDPSIGLSEEQVERRLQEHGYNELKKPPSPSMWALILEQFDDTLVKVNYYFFTSPAFSPPVLGLFFSFFSNSHSVKQLELT